MRNTRQNIKTKHRGGRRWHDRVCGQARRRGGGRRQGANSSMRG